MAMASSLLKLTTILSLVIPLILLTLHSETTSSINIEEDDDEEYVLDNPLPNFRSRSRFLSSLVIKKGRHCNPISYNICNGVSANNGMSLLYCCKTHCRNVLGDENNCGRCGNKCKYDQVCCNGTCTHVAHSEHHCGKCNSKCPKGHKCVHGMCGYA